MYFHISCPYVYLHDSRIAISLSLCQRSLILSSNSTWEIRIVSFLLIIWAAFIKHPSGSGRHTHTNTSHQPNPIASTRLGQHKTPQSISYSNSAPLLYMPEQRDRGVKRVVGNVGIGVWTEWPVRLHTRTVRHLTKLDRKTRQNALTANRERQSSCSWNRAWNLFFDININILISANIAYSVLLFFLESSIIWKVCCVFVEWVECVNVVIHAIERKNCYQVFASLGATLTRDHICFAASAIKHSTPYWTRKTTTQRLNPNRKPTEIRSIYLRGILIELKSGNIESDNLN